MKEILNNICFSYDGIDFNVPINAPWEIYTGLVRSASEYDENIDRSDIDPYFILHLTERCNLKCKYCFEGEKGQRDISKGLAFLARSRAIFVTPAMALRSFSDS